MARRRGLPRFRAANPLVAAGVGRAGRQRADWATLGDHVPPQTGLAEPDALAAALLTARSRFAVLRLDAPAVPAVVMVMVDVPMLGRILRRVGMVRLYFCHGVLRFSGQNYKRYGHCLIVTIGVSQKAAKMTRALPSRKFVYAWRSAFCCQRHPAAVFTPIHAPMACHEPNETRTG